MSNFNAILTSPTLTVQLSTVDVETQLIASSQITVQLDGGAVDGRNGKSAYDLWIDQGNTGTEEDFLRFYKITELKNTFLRAYTTYYKEMDLVDDLVTDIYIYDSAAKTTLLFEKNITYDNDEEVTQVVTINHQNTMTLTKTFDYNTPNKLIITEVIA